MKARVIKTGEIIDVKRLCPAIYVNNRITEEYDDDEIELLDRPKMVSIERVCEFLENNMHDYFDGDNEFAVCDCFLTKENFIEQLKKEME